MIGPLSATESSVYPKALLPAVDRIYGALRRWLLIVTNHYLIMQNASGVLSWLSYIGSELSNSRMVNQRANLHLVTDPVGESA